jgi:hypothetical protein
MNSTGVYDTLTLEYTKVMDAFDILLGNGCLGRTLEQNAVFDKGVAGPKLSTDTKYIFFGPVTPYHLPKIVSCSHVCLFSEITFIK